MSHRTASGALSLARFRGRGVPAGHHEPPGGQQAPAVEGSAAHADGEGEPAVEALPARQTTRIALRCSRNTVQRGEVVRVWGRVVTSRGAGAPNLRVEVYLSKGGEAAEALLGATVSDAQGRFDLQVAVPYHVPAGKYRVFAATSGDARHLPSINP